jgi:hypothetical protein
LNDLVTVEDPIYQVIDKADNLWTKAAEVLEASFFSSALQRFLQEPVHSPRVQRWRPVARFDEDSRVGAGSVDPCDRPWLFPSVEGTSTGKGASDFDP